MSEQLRNAFQIMLSAYFNAIICCSTMRSSENQSSFLFFVVWVLIGKFTLLSLFLAVIMEAFEVAHERIVAEHALAIQDELLGKLHTS